MKNHATITKLIKSPRSLLFILLSVFFSPHPVLAQTVSVAGTVVSQDETPLAGVSVLIKNSQQGTATGADGTFKLENVGSGATVVFSYLGYGNKEVPVSEIQKTPTVVLTDKTSDLNEIVVVGYGTQKKSSLTGSVASVKSKDLVATKNENITNMLAGKLSGVRVIQTSGEPGAFASSIQIRGLGSPLVIIDGVPRENMTRMDPNEIESISVLKDGAAAIYGVRAANGVILITTKKGQKGRAQVEYTGYYGIQTPINTPKGLNAVQYMEIVNENNVMRGALQPGQLEYSLAEIEKYRSGQKTGTEWWRINSDYYAPQHHHNLSVSGSAADVADYFINFSYLNQGGVYKTGDLNYNRYNIRSNLSAQVTKNLKAELLLSGMIDTKNSPYTENTSYWETVWIASPLTPAYANYDRRYMQNIKQGNNPLAITDSDIVGYRRNRQKAFQSTGNLVWDVPWVNGLQAKGSYSFDYTLWEDKTLQKPYNLFDYNLASDEYMKSTYGSTFKGGGNSYVDRAARFSNNSLMQLSLNYQHVFAKKHELGALLLYEEGSTDMDNFSASRYISMTSMEELFGGITDGQNAGMSSAKYNGGTSNGFWKIANKALVGRVNYNYDSKYYAEFAFRYDGSSKYAKGNQWGFFPSAAVAWRLSEESFIKDNLGFINNLKLRASYGVSGDDRTATFEFVPGYTYPGGYVDYWPLLLDGMAAPTVTLNGSINSAYTWMTSKTMNIGLDADMWNGKLGFEVDFFRRNRDGLATRRQGSLPDWLGESFALENLNSDSNLGFDLTIRHRNTVGNKFTYGVSANIGFSRHKNRHVERAQNKNQYDNWRNNPIGRYDDIWWGYGSHGQFHSYEDLWSSPVMDGKGNSELKPGDYKYEDWNGDGVIDDLDVHPLTYGTVNSQSIPLMTFGMTIDLQYMGFDLTMVLQGGALSNVMYDEYLARPFIQNMNGPDYFYDRWHMKDPTADPKDPRTEWISGYLPTTSQASTAMTSNAKASRSTIHRADYLRCKSLEVGYTVPKKATDWIGIQHARVFFSAYNLFTLTGLKYLDPEHPSSGYGTTYPLIRTLNFGATLNF